MIYPESSEETYILYTANDFEDTIQHFGQYVNEYPNIVLFSIYQGSLTLGHRLSKEYGLPHSIMKYQRIEANDKQVTLLYDALYTDTDISYDDFEENGLFYNLYKDKTIFLIDDIYDTGETLRRCNDFIKDNIVFGGLENFCIFSKREKEGLKYHHLDKTKHWVKFLPWEGY